MCSVRTTDEDGHGKVHEKIFRCSECAAGELRVVILAGVTIRALGVRMSAGGKKILASGLVRTWSLVGSPYPLGLRPVEMTLIGVGQLPTVRHVPSSFNTSQ